MVSWRSRVVLSGMAVFVVLAMPASSAWASSTRVVYSFGGDEDGEYPSTDLVLDRTGDLYGTTVLGGEFGGGTVFQVTASGDHTVLHNFTGLADGGQPYGGVTLDPQGHLFGTAVIGGTGGTCPEDGCDVAFELRRRASGGWRFKTLYAFRASQMLDPRMEP